MQRREFTIKKRKVAVFTDKERHQIYMITSIILYDDGTLCLFSEDTFEAIYAPGKWNSVIPSSNLKKAEGYPSQA